MPHLHEQIDFAVGALIVHVGRVLFINHKELGLWLPPGGHIELDEDPEEALHREVMEETGLKVQVLGEKFDVDEPGVKTLPVPAFMDIHDISSGHRHIGMLYIATSKTDKVTLKTDEHHEIRWLTADDIRDSSLNTREGVRKYALEALRRVAAIQAQ